MSASRMASGMVMGQFDAGASYGSDSQRFNCLRREVGHLGTLNEKSGWFLLTEAFLEKFSFFFLSIF
jgi:hypothetical protein